MDRFTFDGSATNFAFRTVAERYRMIDSPMVPVIVARDETAADWVARLSNEWEKSGPLARALQPFTVQIPQRARETLRANDKGDFEAAPLRGDAFFVLSDGGLYRDDFGLWWEQADYLSADQSVI
jgi:CRISPR-associated endonuclease/helicase Cas3